MIALGDTLPAGSPDRGRIAPDCLYGFPRSLACSDAQEV